MKYTIVILYRATHHWLALTRKQRSDFFAQTIAPIMQKFASELHVRLYDSEAFHAKTSDFLLVDCNNLDAYYFFMEHLRDTELFSTPFIELNDIVIGINEGFRDFEKKELAGKA